MFRRFWRQGFVAVTVLATLAMAQPTMAFSKTGQTGRIGAYSVTDGVGLSGVTCAYDAGPGSLQHLRAMWVTPPLAKAVPGMGSEKVGWSYTIQRKIQREGWTNRVTSKILTKYATSSEYEVLPGGKTVKVILPNGPDGPTATYRAVIKMLWYAADGRTVIGTVSGRMDTYFVLADERTNTHGSCLDYISQ
jgi:hypothetical protein